MQTLSLLATPKQSTQALLNGQAVSLNINQLAVGVFADISLNGSPTPILVGVPCRNLILMVRSLYLGFIGDLCFVDQAGVQDPDYTGFGTDPRYVLTYFTPEEVIAFSLGGSIT